MRHLCEDVVQKSAAFAHIDLSRTLFSNHTGSQRSRPRIAGEVTPLRFGGALATLHRGRAFQVQRFTVNSREILYLVTFCLPRFLNREFEDKLVTIFHELYHVSPSFDGDLRRHAGRYCAHTGSQKKYDAHMAKLVKKYLADGADASRLAFLRLSFAQLCQRHRVVVGFHLPRPKLVPVPFTPPRRESGAND